MSLLFTILLIKFYLIIYQMDSNISTAPESIKIANESQSTATISDDNNITVDSTISHVSVGNIRCNCGCVPNIMSLFEMAELRAKRKAAKKSQG